MPAGFTTPAADAKLGGGRPVPQRRAGAVTALHTEGSARILLAMSESGSSTPVPLPKARERTVALLCRHFAEENLTLEEFEARVDRAYRTSAPEELSGLLAGLPDLSAREQPGEGLVPTVRRAPLESVRERGLQIAVMGGSERRGSWVPPRRLLTVAVMGGAGLDFREAALPDGVTEVTVVAMMGGVEIIVPPGLGVQTHGFGLMGGFEALDQASADPAPDAPLLKIRGVACMGGVEVKVMHPGETPRDARRRQKEERRRLRDARTRRLESGE